MTKEKKVERARKILYDCIVNRQPVKVSDLNSFLGISPFTIRKWEYRGIVKKPLIVNGERQYTLEELAEFFKTISEREWKHKNFFRDKQEIDDLAKYLVANVAISDDRKREVKEDPYAYDGDTY